MLTFVGVVALASLAFGIIGLLTARSEHAARVHADSANRVAVDGYADVSERSSRRTSAPLPRARSSSHLRPAWSELTSARRSIYRAFGLVRPRGLLSRAYRALLHLQGVHEVNG